MSCLSWYNLGFGWMFGVILKVGWFGGVDVIDRFIFIDFKF